MPLTRDEMMQPMLEACPSFQSTWDKFLQEWKDEPTGLPHYVALGDLASHLIAMLSRGETESFPTIFGVVERWEIEGDEYVRTAATIGLLEQLGNRFQHGAETEPEDFLQYLLPASRRALADVDAFWLEFFRRREAGPE